MLDNQRIAADMARFTGHRTRARPLLTNRITPEVARLARQAKCSPINMLKIIRRCGLNYVWYSIGGQSHGVFILGWRKGTLDWHVNFQNNQSNAE